MTTGSAVFIADISGLEITAWTNHFSLLYGEPMGIVRALFKLMLSERSAGDSEK